MSLLLNLQGYFGQDGQTVDGMDGSPAFFEEGGKRWFRTGDIGEFDPEGMHRNIKPCITHSLKLIKYFYNHEHKSK